MACLLGCSSAVAQKATTEPLPQATTAPSPSIAPASPKLHGTHAHEKYTLKATGWSEQEVATATARCTQLLKGLDVVVAPAPAIREGGCGTPAPVELISLGKSPQVSFSPPVTVTCDMVAAMHQWVTKDIQPLAIKLLGAPIIRIDTMSSYSCRTAYGRTKSRLSEHGVANAIDIRAFLTAKAQTADLLADWGPTAREVTAQVAAARAASIKAEAERAAALAKQGKPNAGPTIAAPQTPATAPALTQNEAIKLPRPTITVGPSGSPALSFPGATGSVGISNAIGQPPSRLGGPKEPNPVASANSDPVGARARSQFLRGIHASACKIFGTVLGPEANDAHKNHFHVDMAERKSGAFCE
jgi:hypothetical protein